MATEIQRERLRGDLDADDDALTDAEIDDAFARAGEQYGDNSFAVEAAARVLAIQQLLAGAAKRADYAQNASSERRSQVFDHLMRLRAIYEATCRRRWSRRRSSADCGASRRGSRSIPMPEFRDVAQDRAGACAGSVAADRRSGDGDHDPARDESCLMRRRCGSSSSDSAREDLDVRRGLEHPPGVQRAVVFGVRNHPTVADTDIQRGDRFVVGATEFEVIGGDRCAGRSAGDLRGEDVKRSDCRGEDSRTAVKNSGQQLTSLSVARFLGGE